MSNSLGIYFGPKLINMVETRGRKIVNNIQIPQSTISASELEEKVPAEIKLVGLTSLFKDELRKNKINAKEATLCLSGKDMIVRTFEIPQLPREELRSAIYFEAKKYIPFKIEELISDFQLRPDRSSRVNLVLFMGLKKETLARCVSILDQLDIKVKAIEYSAFSILRSLTLTGSSNSGVIGVLGADLQGKDEVNFTVLENGFPLFSRDFSLTEGPEQTQNPETSEQGTILEKLKTEMRVSLDYYHRKFAAKSIKKIFCIINQEYRPDMEAFMAEVGLPIKFIDTARFMDKFAPYSLSAIKGYSASLSSVMKTGLDVNLLSARDKAKLQQERSVQKEPAVSFEGFQFNFKVILLGLMIVAATFGFGLYRMRPLQIELNSIISKRPEVSTIMPEATYSQLTSKETEFNKKLLLLDNLIKKQLYLTKPLGIIPRVIPEGIMLTDLTFHKTGEGNQEFFLTGIVYLGDSDKELKAVNKFVENLKENPELSEYFNQITISSLDRKEIKELQVTNFTISCKAH